jgi:predicted permease
MRWYRLLLYLYPPEFRRVYGSEMTQYARGLEAMGGPRLALVRELLLDILRSVPREWGATLTGNRIPKPPHQSGDRMKNIAGDVRFALRLLVKNPGFALAAIVTLALGIGANTAMFSLARATLLNPVKVSEPGELRVWSWSSSHPDFREYQQRTDVFTGVAAESAGRMNLTWEGSSELLTGMYVSGNAFSVLGVPAALGRPLQPSDDQGPGAPVTGVVAHQYWRTRLGANPDVVGRPITVNGVSVTIVGVAAEGFTGTSLSARPAIFLPLTSITQIETGFFARPAVLEHRGLVWLTVFGRVRKDVTPAQATEQMDTHYRRLHPPSDPNDVERLVLVPLATTAMGGETAPDLQRFVALLVGVVGVTLLIGCANLANLLLARAATRRRELAVRVAIGATRGRLARQLLLESTVLALIGGAAGVGVAHLTLGLLGSYQLPGPISIAALDLQVDRAALVVSMLLSIGTGLLFGAAPAWRATRSDLLTGLHEGARAGMAAVRLRSTLLAAQVALSLVLLAGAGLFLRSLVNALDRPLGFDVDGVASVSVNLGLARYDDGRATVYYDEALRRVAATPGVTAAAWTTIVPTRGDMTGTAEQVDGYERRDREVIRFHIPKVGPDFFKTAGIRMIAGREFLPTDLLEGPGVTIINRAAAEKYWAGRNPIGGRVMLSQKGGWLEVVGVCENTVISELGEEAAPMAYLPIDRDTGGLTTKRDSHHLMIRTSGDADAVVPLVRDALRGIDPAVPIYGVRTMRQTVAPLVMPQQMGLTLLALSGLLAVSLATVGIYGVASYVASMRTRELAIRVALGATALQIRRLVLLQGALPVVAGLLTGVILALWATRLAAKFMFGITAADPLTFTTVTLLLGLLALAASYLPARRASLRQPVAALRQE